MVTYNVNLEGKTILVTGAAGFIGANLCKRLLSEYPSVKVIGIDSITGDGIEDLKNLLYEEGIMHEIRADPKVHFLSSL